MSVSKRGRIAVKGRQIVSPGSSIDAAFMRVKIAVKGAMMIEDFGDKKG